MVTPAILTGCFHQSAERVEHWWGTVTDADEIASCECCGGPAPTTAPDYWAYTASGQRVAVGIPRCKRCPA